MVWKGFTSKKNAMNAAKKFLKRSRYGYGTRGGKIPVAKIRPVAIKLANGRYMVIGVRKRR